MNLLLFALVISVALILERFVNAVCFTMLYLIARTGESEHTKGLASVQVTAGAAGSVVGFFSSVVTIITQVVGVLMQWMVTSVVLFVLSCFLYVMFQYATDVLFELGQTYNSGLGASLQILVVWPVKILTWIFEALCPVYNAVFWIIKKMPFQVLAQTVMHDLDPVIQAIASFSLACRASAMSLVGWVGSFICCDASDAFCNDRCFEAGERVLDLLSPLAHVRNMVVWIVRWLSQMCAVLSAPVDIVTYPFMDINFAKGIHFLSNSVLYFFFHLPAMTVERCTRYKADSVVMCIPDFDPAINMMVSGFRYMGFFVDNWLDVSLLVVNAALKRPVPECTSLPDLLRDFDFKNGFFGNNETVIAGMTEHMFARTDGLGVQYFSLDRDWQTVLHPDAFPFRVSSMYGVAAISHFNDADHDAKGDDTTGLLGCACYHTNIGLQLKCGVALFGVDTSEADRTIPVTFQLPSTGQLLKCNKVMVKVESIRWPVSRFTATKVQRMDGRYAQDVGCSGKGTCLMADAAIWVRPMCSVDTIDLVCVDSFKQAACFPYCMALHVRGSGTQPLVLHDAGEWSDGVTMLRRDCGLHSMSASTTDSGGVRVQIPNSAYGLGATFPVSTACTQNPLVNSIVPRSNFTEYSAHESIDLDSQPFLFTGDLALTAIKGQKGSDNKHLWSIQVQRIFGNQANEFTTIPLNQGIPSLGPCTTPDNCDNIAAACQSGSGCKAAIPYGYDASVNAHVIGAVTPQYVFWVTNPSLEPFYAFATYCRNRNNSNTNLLQISVTSSYGGIRLWRINPYLYCPVDRFTGKQVCPEQQAASTRQLSSLDFQGTFELDICDQRFDVMAVDMDYINEDNIALTVLRTTLTNVNIYSLRPIDASLAEWVTIWVNPNTMETREDRMWMPEASSPALTQGVLCPSQRRMPNAGSLVAELLSSVVLMLRMPLNVVLSLPVVMDIAGNRCPVRTAGHSLLKNCGDELLSLDDSFSAMFRANTLFWQTVAIIADSFGPGAPQTFMNGVAIAGDNGGWAAMLPGMAKQFSAISEMDVAKAQDVISSTIATLPSPVNMARLAVKNPIAYLHVYYRLGSRMLMQILQASQGSRTVANVFWNVISDGKQDFEDIVLQRTRRTCGGFAIMAGFSSPLGRLINHWCVAWAEFQAGMLTIASVFFVDIPLVDCVCVRSTGSNFVSYARENCWSNAPDLQKPMVNSLIALGSNDACPALVSMTQSHFKESMDPFFARLEAGIREVGSVLDWFVHANYEGDCNNFADNPYVLALIPQPVDYFRVCGMTDMCRLRCLSEFQAFEARNFAPPSSEVVTKTVQSMFFNSQDPDTQMPLRPQAMMELRNCTQVCGFVQTVGGYTDRCFLLAGEGWTGELEVISFCVPMQLGANVRRGGPAWTIENLVPGAFQVGFVFAPDPFVFWNSFQLLTLTTSALWACHESCLKLYDIGQFDSQVTRLKRFAIFGNTVVVEALIPDGVGYFTAKSAAFCMSYSLQGLSSPVPCTTNAWDSQGWPICSVDEANNCNAVLLLPRTSDEKVQTCSLETATLKGCTTYETSRDFVYQASLTGTGIVSQSIVQQVDTAVWNIFMTTPPEQVSHWLLLCKVNTLPNGLALGSSASSLDSPLTLTMKRQCSLQNCVGCTDLGLQRLCYAAQQCQLGRCIGTMVHQNRPLCAVGMYVQAMLAQQESLVSGAWLIVADTMVGVLALSGGVNLPSAVTWPDQAFYGFICAAKDVSASGISIVMSSIQGIVQSASATPMAQADNGQIANSAMIVFSMTMAATTNFLNQVALGPLYMLMAVQKTYVCSVNSVLAVVGKDKSSVTVGDPAIQEANSRALGRCMTQFAAENSQGDGSGVDNEQSTIDSVVGDITTLAMNIQLDAMIHPLDATLTWMQGVVSGLQDIVQTADRNT